MPYHAFKDEDGSESGSFETFYQDSKAEPCLETSSGPGWYWWACLPGCLPDGEPSGPFESEEEAIKDAQGGA